MTSRNKIYDKRAFSMKEAAEYACVSRATVENWVTKGLLPCEELPGSGDGKYRFRRIRKNDFDEFLDKLYSGNNQVEWEKSKKELILLPRNS